MGEIAWGEVVRIAAKADGHERMGEIGSVCGFRSTSAGRVVLVEFADGTAEEFAEDCLAPVDVV